MPIALAHHQAGRLAEAERIYRRVLAERPGHAGALHLLGVIAAQVGDARAAIDLIGRAIAIAPDCADYHDDLGESCRLAGDRQRAVASFHRALDLRPGHAGTLVNLGNVLWEMGRYEEAIAACRQALARQPDSAGACNNLGNALKDSGRLAEAAAAFERALELQPGLAAVHNNLGCTRLAQRDLAAAIAAFEQAIILAPGLAELHFNLGNALREADRLDEAIAAYERARVLRPEIPGLYRGLALALHRRGRLGDAIAAYQQALAREPRNAELLTSLGHALWTAGRPDEAVAAGRRAVALEPGLAEAHSNLGNALCTTGRHDEAVAACRQAIALKPELPEAHNNLGNALQALGRHDDAIAAFRRAIALDATRAEPFNNLGCALFECWRIDEALASFQRALEIDVHYAQATKNLGTVRLAAGDLDGARAALARARELTHGRPEAADAHSNSLMLAQYESGVTALHLARVHAEWDACHAAPLAACVRAGHAGDSRARDPDRDRDPERRLRLGFVSADLRRHPVGFFLLPVFRNLDPAACEVVCYNTRSVRDEHTERLAASAGQWHDVAGLSDPTLAGRIRSDRIDILFDLAGHTAGNRLLVFARKPAPLQATWIGYVGTTGLSALDYLIADRHHVPPGTERHYRETVLRMPDGYVCFDPPAEAPPVGPLPSLAEGVVTFGSFNNVPKLSRAVLALWAQVLRRVPGSRLLLASPALESRAARERVSAALRESGVDRARLVLQGAQGRRGLLALYNQVDVALDPFPYSGGITTCEALWMGVPVVTRPGDTFAGRHALSHLSNAGLTDIDTVAADDADYVVRAVELATDLTRLAALRAALRDRMARSPLCDAPRFARNFESLLRGCWRRWCGATAAGPGGAHGRDDD